MEGGLFEEEEDDSIRERHREAEAFAAKRREMRWRLTHNELYDVRAGYRTEQYNERVWIVVDILTTGLIIYGQMFVMYYCLYCLLVSCISNRQHRQFFVVHGTAQIVQSVTVGKHSEYTDRVPSVLTKYFLYRTVLSASYFQQLYGLYHRRIVKEG